MEFSKLKLRSQIAPAGFAIQRPDGGFVIRREQKHELLKLVAGALLVHLLFVPLAHAAPPDQEPTTVYVVQLDDTLSAIASRYDSTVQALVQANGIKDPNLIHPGQRLVIPSASPPQEPATQAQVHVVHRGETLYRIAQLYGTTVQALVAANNLADPNLIHRGQKLIIPSAMASPAEPLPAPFVAVELTPSPIVQGQTLVVKVKAEGIVGLSGLYDKDRPVVFVEGEQQTLGERWALVGIHALTEVGAHPLKLTATDAEGQQTEVLLSVPVVDGGYGVENIVLPPDRSALLDPDLIKAEWERLAQVFGVFGRQQLWAGPFIVPAEGPITSQFGTRRSYNGGPARSYHEGIDYDVPPGAAVLAANDGQVALAEPLTVRGNAVIIDHGLGIHSGYYHLSEINVQEGQQVKQGNVVGKVGDTGLATGPHLHWEIRVRGINVDPAQWTWQTIP
ncbi:MAG: LysM peptidoglycan-binding domain-containing protein [Anaerolineales bacterium]|nr:MAG: LysM peptidoglycan-binding domain-containing protein [Anaerolineales bacterium]